MAAGLLKLQQQVEDLDAGPREQTPADEDEDDSAEASARPAPRGTAFGFGRPS